MTPGYGTIITADATNSNWASNGFDFQQVHGSMEAYNPVTKLWKEVTSVYNPIQTTAGYFLYIRGDRSQLPSGSTIPTQPTVLRTIGTVISGDSNGIACFGGYIPINGKYLCICNRF